MKIRPLKNDEEIQVGDRLKTDTAFGTTWHTFHRVTAKYAFVKWSNVAEGKFHRTFSTFSYHPVGEGPWPTNTYTPCRPVEAAPEATPTVPLGTP